MRNLIDAFGQIDIYLFDQILRGRVRPGMCILDAGCGGGRNLVYLLRRAMEDRLDIHGTDASAQSIDAVRRLASSLAPLLPESNFRVEPVEAMSIPDATADFVISSAVLHFARDDHHFRAMLHGTWSKLKAGGLFFCRLASSIGIEDQIHQIDGRRFLLPDGTERYLVTESLLNELSEHLGGAWADPLKTTVVQNQRSMTTWVLRKNR